jgi:exo-beta-1,3-glucanase (GH17 family)
VHAERVLAVIEARQLDLKVLLGVWISGGKATADAANRVQLDRAVALAEQYPQLVVAISVGNETLDSWSNVRTPPADLAAYIQEVRRRTSLPVTTDDSYLPFLLGADGDFSYADVIEVLRVVDFLSIHVYAFADAFWGSWDYQQESVPEGERAAAMMAAALAYTRDATRQVREVLAAHDLDMPVVIGELGWKSKTKHDASAPPEDAIELFFSHPVNQKIYYDAMLAWTYGDARDGDSPDAAFHFEAFDEPWKDAWGDDGWGLFDVDRKAKYVLWEAFPSHRPADAPDYTAADAVYYRP